MINKKIKLLLNFLGLSLILLIFYFKANSMALIVPTFHLDGAFQTASSLFRLSAGEIIGKDFFPYLGIGPTLVLYPTFQLFGSNLVASVTSSYFVTYLSGWIALSTIFYLSQKTRNILYTMAVGYIALHILLYFNIYYFDNPGNSLRPIRSFIPYICGICCFYIIYSRYQMKNKVRLSGICLGIAMIWSNDYALPTVLIFFTFYLIYFKKQYRYPLISSSIWIALYIICTYSILLATITQLHSYNLLSYNFLSVAPNQSWYFAPYHPDYRIYSLETLIDITIIEYYKEIILFFILLLFSIRRLFLNNCYRYLIICAIISTFFVAATLSTIFGHYETGYYIPFIISIYSTYAFICIQYIFLALENCLPSQKILTTILYSTILTSLFLYYSYEKQAYYNQKKSLADNAQYFYVPEYGGYLNKIFQTYIDYMDKHKHTQTVEEYWGLWGAYNRNPSIWPVDAIIHALGKEKIIAGAAYEDIEQIITTKLDSPWIAWNFSLNYWFYQQIIKNYEPKLITPTTIIWSPSFHTYVATEYNCIINENQTSFTIQTDIPGIYEIDLTYKLKRQPSIFPSLVLLKDNINYTFLSNGYRPINPHETKLLYPVYVSDSSDTTFSSKILGDSTQLIITNCNASLIQNKNMQLFYELFQL